MGERREGWGSADNEEVIGVTLSRYRIVSRLGSGGMGDVYRAEDLRLRRTVALKIIRPDDMGVPATDRLLAEARAASGLSHPSIAVIYEVDEAEVEQAGAESQRMAFIAMEYVDGRTLQELVASGQLTCLAVLDIGRQVAEALAEAHERGLVHRDIKPSNVMMTDTGRVKVLDFGIAFQMVPTVAETDETTRTDDPLRAHGFIGTLPYVAPEQATGRDVDGRADMFSLGVLLYELLAGARPFKGDTTLQTFEALLKDDPAPLPAHGTDVRLPRMERIIRRMLEKDRGQRYASLREVAAALADVERAGDGAMEADRADADAAPADDDAQSLAVMGFTNISGNAEDEWLGTGIAETLAADLARLDDVTIVGRERVYELLRTLAERVPERGAALFLRAGRELGVRWVLSGGFQRTGDAVRVTASLTDAASGRIVRSVKVDGRLSGIFDVQDRVVSELAEGLKQATVRAAGAAAGGGTGTGSSNSMANAGAGAVGAGPGPGAQAAAGAGAAPEKDTALVEAYEAFSKGVINFRVESYESIDRASLLFERAIRLDPSYARAHLELGSVYSTKADYLALPELHERALASYRRALALRPESVRGWRGLGLALVSMGQHREGMAAIRRAMTIDPLDAGAHGAMARALFVGQGRFLEAADKYDHALELNPKAGWYALQLAHCLALAREFARGEAAARQAIALQEDFLSGGDGVVVVGAYMRQGHISALQERYDEAAGYFQRELDFLGRVDHALRDRILVELNLRLGFVHLRLGNPQRAQVAFDVALVGFERRVRLGADDPFTRYYAAGVHALRGDEETALAFLERCMAERPALTRARARIEPEFAAMRNDARFVRLVDSPSRSTMDV